jgi:hypothetical protein
MKSVQGSHQKSGARYNTPRDRVDALLAGRTSRHNHASRLARSTAAHMDEIVQVVSADFLRCDDHRLPRESGRNPRCISPMDWWAKAQELRRGELDGAGLQDGLLVRSKEASGRNVGISARKCILLELPHEVGK